MSLHERFSAGSQWRSSGCVEDLCFEIVSQRRHAAGLGNKTILVTHSALRFFVLQTTAKCQAKVCSSRMSAGSIIKPENELRNRVTVRTVSDVSSSNSVVEREYGTGKPWYRIADLRAISTYPLVWYDQTWLSEGSLWYQPNMISPYASQSHGRSSTESRQDSWRWLRRNGFDFIFVGTMVNRELSWSRRNDRAGFEAGAVPMYAVLPADTTCPGFVQQYPVVVSETAYICGEEVDMTYQVHLIEVHHDCTVLFD